MSKRERRHVRLADYKDTKAREGAIDIETEDGQVFTIPPPELWPDAALQLMRGEQIDVLAIGPALLGDEQYAAFVAAGGSAAIIAGIVKDEHQLDLPE